MPPSGRQDRRPEMRPAQGERGTGGQAEWYIGQGARQEWCIEEGARTEWYIEQWPAAQLWARVKPWLLCSYSMGLESEGRNSNYVCLEVERVSSCLSRRSIVFLYSVEAGRRASKYWWTKCNHWVSPHRDGTNCHKSVQRMDWNLVAQLGGKPHKLGGNSNFIWKIILYVYIVYL